LLSSFGFVLPNGPYDRLTFTPMWRRHERTFNFVYVIQTFNGSNLQNIHFLRVIYEFATFTSLLPFALVVCRVRGVLHHADVAFPQLDHVLPRQVEQWIYPIDKTALDVLGFAHFLARAAIIGRLVPKGWPGLKSRWLRPLVLCGRHSLEGFRLGVFLASAGYFLLAEVSGGVGLHFLVAITGLLIMSAAAWLSRHKYSDKGRRG
jgi:hypothetical protein